MINHCFVDIETQKISTDFPDSWGAPVMHFDDPTKELTDSNVPFMGFGYAATYDLHHMRLWTDPVQLLEYLASDEVQKIVTYNGERFDFNVLLGSLDAPVVENGVLSFSDAYQQFYRALACKSVDLAVHVKNAAGRRVSLNAIITAMFGYSKIGDGKDAWKFFISDDLDKRLLAINYLLDDVVQLFRIFGVAHELGQLAYRDNMGQDILIDNICVNADSGTLVNAPF